MKLIWDLLLALLPRLFDPLVNMVKQELLKVYVLAVEGLRQVFTTGMLVIFAAMLALAGFVLVHIALFLLLPWDAQTNAYIMLGLGLSYFALATFVVTWLCSRERWFKASGAERMADKIMSEERR